MKAIAVVGEVTNLLHVDGIHYRISLVLARFAALPEIAKHVTGGVISRIGHATEILKRWPDIDSDVAQVSGRSRLQIVPELFMSPVVFGDEVGIDVPPVNGRACRPIAPRNKRSALCRI